MRSLALSLSCLVGVVLTQPALGQDDGPVIVINAPEKVVHPLGLPVFEMVGSGPRALATQVTAIVAGDLTFTGLFTIVDRDAYLEKPGTVGVRGEGTNWEDWRVLKVSVLGRGAIQTRGNQVRIEVSAFHVPGAKRIGTQVVEGRSEDIEQVAHDAANALYELLTGSTGFFRSEIAYISTAGGNKEVFIAAYDGTGARPITRNRSINLSPAWSRDGRRLAFTSYVRGNPDLYLYDRATSKFYRLSNRRGLNIGAAFSPAGRVLAATLSLRRGNPEIYLINEDGTGPRRLTNSFANDVSPTWSPDARKIAFVSDRAGNPNIYVMSSAGGSAKRITFKGKDNQSPAWSPRGDRIAYASRVSGRWQIFTMAPDGEDARQVTVGRAHSEDPTWSPDGRMIMFVRGFGKKTHLWVMEADGSNPRQVTSGKGSFTNPSWGPQGASR